MRSYLVCMCVCGGEFVKMTDTGVCLCIYGNDSVEKEKMILQERS